VLQAAQLLPAQRTPCGRAALHDGALPRSVARRRKGL
jgi:hypothetical protein